MKAEDIRRLLSSSTGMNVTLSVKKRGVSLAVYNYQEDYYQKSFQMNRRRLDSYEQFNCSVMKKALLEALPESGDVWLILNAAGLGVVTPTRTRFLEEMDYSIKDEIPEKWESSIEFSATAADRALRRAREIANAYCGIQAIHLRVGTDNLIVTATGLYGGMQRILPSNGTGNIALVLPPAIADFGGRDFWRSPISIRVSHSRQRVRWEYKKSVAIFPSAYRRFPIEAYNVFISRSTEFSQSFDINCQVMLKRLREIGSDRVTLTMDSDYLWFGDQKLRVSSLLELNEEDAVKVIVEVETLRQAIQSLPDSSFDLRMKEGYPLVLCSDSGRDWISTIIADRRVGKFVSPVIPPRQPRLPEDYRDLLNQAEGLVRQTRNRRLSETIKDNKFFLDSDGMRRESSDSLDRVIASLSEAPTFTGLLSLGA